MERSRLSNLFGKLNEWAHSPLYGVLLTVLGVFTGLLGSLFSDDIKRSFPFTWSHEHLSTVSIAFWLLLLVFSFLFYFRHNAASQEQEHLVNQTILLAKLVRTLPPVGFLTSFAEYYSLSHQAALKPFEQKSKDLAQTIDEIEHAIRVVLDGVISLAHIFDGKPQNRTYAANLMLYVPIVGTDAAKMEDISRNIKFVEPGLDLAYLDGVLELHTEFSTTTATQEATPDHDLSHLYLPIPKERYSTDGQLVRYLPGAPMAYVTKHMNIYEDSTDLGKWCEENGDFSPTVCHAVRDYFSGDLGQHIRSFASIPIVVSNDEDPRGVLNIHRDQAGLLNEKQPVKQFAPLLEPFVCLIFDLLILLDTHKKKLKISE